MSYSVLQLPAQTIKIGATDSPGILWTTTGTDGQSQSSLRHIESLLICAPAVLDGGLTFSVQVSPDMGANWYTLQSNNADVVLAATKALMLFRIAATGIRIHASGAVGTADKTFQVNGWSC